MLTVRPRPWQLVQATTWVKLAENAALGPPDLSVAPASGASVYGRARLVARARAAITAFKAVYFNFFLDTEYRLFERQHHALLQVSASLSLAGPARGVSKEGVENVAKAAENVESVKGTVPTGVGANSGFAEPVVLSAFFGVRQDLIRFVDPLEFFFGVRAFVAVGMKFHGLFSKGLSNLLVVNVSGYAEDGVVVLVWHYRSLFKMPLCRSTTWIGRRSGPPVRVGNGPADPWKAYVAYYSPARQSPQ